MTNEYDRSSFLSMLGILISGLVSNDTSSLFHLFPEISSSKFSE